MFIFCKKQYMPMLIKPNEMSLLYNLYHYDKTIDFH